VDAILRSSYAGAKGRLSGEVEKGNKKKLRNGRKEMPVEEDPGLLVRGRWRPFTS